MRRFVPSVVTGFGLVLGLAGLHLWPAPWAAPLLMVSLACDALDGHLARKLGAESDAGKNFDWYTDIALAHIAAFKSVGSPLNAALIAGHVWSNLFMVKFSGRAALFVTLAGWALIT